MADPKRTLWGQEGMLAQVERVGAPQMGGGALTSDQALRLAVQLLHGLSARPRRLPLLWTGEQQVDHMTDTSLAWGETLAPPTARWGFSAASSSSSPSLRRRS